MVIIRIITMVMMTSMTMPIVIIMKCVTSQIHRCHQSVLHKNQEVATPYSLDISRMVIFILVSIFDLNHNKNVIQAPQNKITDRCVSRKNNEVPPRKAWTISETKLHQILKKTNFSFLVFENLIWCSYFNLMGHSRSLALSKFVLSSQLLSGSNLNHGSVGGDGVHFPDI